MSEEPIPQVGPPQPNRDLLLAQALDACIQAERQKRGSAEQIIVRQPGWARSELRRLVDLACALDVAATHATISPEFRADARARLMQRTSGQVDNAGRPRLGPVPLSGTRLSSVPSRNDHGWPGRKRSRRWLWRGSAGLLAAVLATAATLTASASALPGEPLYSVKQAQEELGLRLVGDDQARALALLNRADARLDETARLLQLGRADDAAAATLRYDQTVMLATATYVVTIEDAASGSPVAADLDTRLVQQQEQLQSLLRSAPETARPDIREALVATERGRALVADPAPVERALGRRPRETAVAAPALEQVPTLVPTRAPTAVVAAVRHDEISVPVVLQPERRDEDEVDRRPVVAAVSNPGVVTTTNNNSRGQGGPPVGVPLRVGRGSDELQRNRGEDVNHDEDVNRGDGGDRQDDASPQQQPVFARSNGQENDDSGGGRGSDHVPTTVTIAPKPAAPAAPVVQAAPTRAPAPATVAKENSGGLTNNDTRPAPTPAPAQVVRPAAATATPVRAQRSGADDRNSTSSPLSPAKPSSGSGSKNGGEYDNR